MLDKKKRDIKPLSRDFVKDVSQDGVKIAVLPAKILLRMLCLWPDSFDPKIVFANWCLYCNLFIIECFHVVYVALNFDDNLVGAITTLATVTTTLEALVRIYSLMFKKHIINDVLYKMWKNFWPVSIANKNLAGSIRRNVFISFILPSSFLCLAIASNLLITGVPLVKYNALILNSVYPFQWNQTYAYECLFVWQYFFDWFVLLTINGFDFLFVPLVMICAAQFRIIQEVFNEMFTDVSKSHRKIILGREDASHKELLLKCLEQHELLLDICTSLENSFNMVLLIQYTTSTMSICSSSLVLRVDKSQFSKMFTYAIAHIVQLFYYCFVGQELTYQSSYLSDVIYGCNWHYDYDRNLRKAMIMMIQRSQRECVLTAAGVTNLDFAGFVKVMRLSFSFYTLFNSVMDRKGL